MTVVSGKRRGRGEDSIYWDEAKDRYVGVVSLGYSASGTRVRKKVMGRTKTEVREKLRELHSQVESGVRPRRHYTVNDALDDFLENGLDGLAPATVTVYRNTIAKALREELLESTKLVKFQRYAEFTVAGLAGNGLQLWATGQRPHYDVVYEGNDLESLVTRLAAAPHLIVDNPSVDREEH